MCLYVQCMQEYIIIPIIIRNIINDIIIIIIIITYVNEVSTTSAAYLLT